jgi:uncharacterized protein (TIGR02246 family)
VRFFRQKGGIEALREEIESQIQRRERYSTAVEVPLSAECKRILNVAAEEAQRLGSAHIGTEHLLLGILREEKCFAARLLAERGLSLELLREELGQAPAQQASFAGGGVVYLSQLVNAWKSGNAAGFARCFDAEGQFVDPQGDLSVGPAQIVAAAHRIFKALGWAKCEGKIEDVVFIGAKAVMANLVWEAAEASPTPNPRCVRMTVILTQKPEGWSVARVQATGMQPQSRSAAV